MLLGVSEGAAARYPRDRYEKVSRMVRTVSSVSALLFGSALLLFAGGIHGLILPIRGSAEGFSAVWLGLLGTGWALGYVSGCLLTPRLVGRVGHIRAFGVMCAFAAVSILMSLILVSPGTWIPLRAVAGFCFAGAAMIVERWLNEQAEPNTRGKIFGIYTMVNLVASTGGQMSLTLGDTTGFLFFVLAAMFYCLALVPTAVSSTRTPQPLTKVNLDLGALWRNSPVAVVAVLLVGVSNGAFSALAAVYADRIGLALTAVALFSSLPIMAGAIVQIPVGALSDRLDRRAVLLGLAVLALGVDLAFVLIQPESRMMNLLLICAFGGAIFSMYPVIVAHASDHAADGTYIQISGGLLMVFGLGSIIGPLIAGLGMTNLGNFGLFLTSFGAHVLMILFTVYRMLRSEAVADEQKGNFVISTAARTSTPETAALSSGENPEGTEVGEPPQQERSPVPEEAGA